jgi:hypothetical protein
VLTYQYITEAATHAALLHCGQAGLSSEMRAAALAEALRNSLVQLRITHIDSDEVSVHYANRSHYVRCLHTL